MHELTQREMNIPFAIASRYAKGETDHYEELVAVGNLALVKAACLFDEDRGVKFCTYAFLAVRRAIFAESGMAAARRTAAQFGIAATLSLDAPLVGGGTLGESVCDYRSQTNLDCENSESVERALRCMSPHDRNLYVLRHRDGLSFREIGKRVGRSGQAVRVEIQRICGHLRRRVRAIGRRPRSMSH